MQFPPPSSAESPACEIASDILQRLEGRGRERTFSKDEPIPTRSGLLYWVKQGYCLPYPLTHAQIGSLIGVTRVTVTRLMTRLRERGLIELGEENVICLSPALREPL
jgi:CRP-like cAMP-binding protein